MASAGLQRRRRECLRCGLGYIHTNRMERRDPNKGGGWDRLENRWFNTHTLACRRKALALGGGKVLV